MSTPASIARPGASPALGVRRFLARPVAGRDIALGDVLLAAIAFPLGILIVTMAPQPDFPFPAGGFAEAMGMLLIALPLLLRRSAPVAAVGLVAAALLLNIAVFGEHVRCGVVLPITAYLGFVAFRRGAPKQLPLAALAVATVILATSAWELGMESVPFLTAILGGAALAGFAVRRRDRVVDALRRESRALEAQRDQTARMAVETERARIGKDLGATIDSRVSAVLHHAEAGRNGDAAAAFSEIEREGRAGLTDMRGVLEELTPAGLAPQPTLAELNALLAAGRERATVRFDGERRALDPGVERAACRIVELLLTAVDPRDRGVQVRVEYRADALEVELTGTQAVGDDDVAVAAARERAATVGGSVGVSARGAKTVVRLPAGAHA